jgi:ATP-dependent helicase/nuclease subunit A
MSSAAFLPFSDDHERQVAIDPRRSFTVQAPAGSGKTELLIQRFLSLLATVEKPETIVAITFTRKAAGEMRERILKALRDAAKNSPLEKPHEERTRGLALAALTRNDELGWDLLDHPNRLRIETIDALSMSIAGAMPWLARLGAMPQIQDDNTEAYDEAARRTVLDIEGDDEHAEALETLLGHLDNDALRSRALIANMLQRRDQWMQLAFSSVEEERHLLEGTLERAVRGKVESIEELIPTTARAIWLDKAGLAEWPKLGDAEGWLALRNAVLTTGNKWRKKGADASLMNQLSTVDGLLEALLRVEYFPPLSYSEDQWDVLQALFVVLRRAVVQLQQVFRERGVVDFSEIGQAARRALDEAGNPTELAFRLDSRIDHLLIDEFQDTSRGQFELILQLISGWEPEDGRTLFLVGDPMQSIYRFRQAEVSLFLHVRNQGIGSLRPESLKLTSNYRTSPTLLHRINHVCEIIFPKSSEEDMETGRISFTHCYPEVKEDDCEWRFHSVSSTQEEARRIVELIHAARARNSKETVAVLVRARTHLPEIVKALKEAGLVFQAVDVDQLSTRPVVQDLLSLTRAMLHPGDRISWLAILRAPWCGLTLADLEALVRERSSDTIWNALQDLSTLSDDGQLRAARLRDVLAEAQAERTSWPLRHWVERAWIMLGGPACLAGDERQLQDANDFLDLLEREQSGSDLRDFDRFPALVKKLFSRPDPKASNALQVMTIHAAKGLEFDTVILPGLERPDRRDENQLFLFHEWPGDKDVERLLAPIHATGAEDDAIYRYIRKIEEEKSDNERLRLFYVAVTRAKQRLYLFGQLSQRKDGRLSADKGSMLRDMLPALTPDELSGVSSSSDSGDDVKSARSSNGSPGRLSTSWKLPDLPSPLDWDGAGLKRTEPHDPTFEWVGETLRIAGTIVHAYLQRVPGADAPIPEMKSVRAALAHAGLSAEEIPSAATRVRDALERTLKSQRGRWILKSHNEARSEYAVSGVVNGEIVYGKIDRTFIDEHGTRWIVDFKTSSHEGTDLAGFLDEQQRRYSDQMSRYACILAPLGNPVRLGLYFPLLDEWREWEPNAEPRP